MILALSLLLIFFPQDTVAVTLSADSNPVIMQRVEAEKLYADLKTSGRDPRMFRALTVALAKLPHPLWQECNWVRRTGQETKVRCELFP